MTDSFAYLDCTVTNDIRQAVEISARLEKGTKAFNMLRCVIWHRKSVSTTARLRVLRAFVLLALLFLSETWAHLIKQEQRVAIFYYRRLRTIIGVNPGDRMSNEQLVDITCQPTIENVTCRRCLRWFGHLNRRVDVNMSVKLAPDSSFFSRFAYEPVLILILAVLDTEFYSLSIGIIFNGDHRAKINDLPQNT